MRRIFNALFVAVVAAVLSVVLAVPASAADPVTPDPRFKYGLKYFYQEIFDPGNPKGWKEIDVSKNVNPSKVGGSYYLNQVKKNVELNAANKPLTGKIIEPGKSIVRAPSTYATAPKFVAGGTPGFSKLLGGLGIGIGATAQAPSNSAEIALSQGVSAGCVDGTVACTGDEINKRFVIDSCGINGTCPSIGGVGPNGESILGDWFKTDALPFLADLWKKLTGQGNDGDELPDANGHLERTPRFCYNVVNPDDLTFLSGTNNVELRPSIEVVNPRPGTYSADQVNWDNKCAPVHDGNISKVAINSMMDTTCVDKTTGKSVGTDGLTLGVSWSPSQSGVFDNATKKNIVNMCKSGANNVLQAVQFKNTSTSTTEFNVMKYTRIENPNPEATALDTIEGLTVTTTSDCQAADGTIRTLSVSVAKTAAFAAPTCPEGSTLVRHDVKSSTAGGTTATLDEGSAAPGAAAAYPECLAGSGCTMDVHLDGSVCTTARTECHTWPAIAASQPSRVDCMWGTYTMPTSDCFSLSNAYKSESGVVFDPASGAWIAIDAYGNPIQPNPEPWNPTNPNPIAGATPGTGTGTGTFPGSGLSPADGCVSPSWSWNPVDWVKNPVVCALQDAFVPKMDVAARVAELQTLASTRPPLSWISPPVVGPGGGGCPNWVVTLPGLSENVVCESSFTNSIVAARGPLFGLVATAMVWPLMRAIWYAAIPILRVSPGSSK